MRQKLFTLGKQLGWQGVTGGVLLVLAWIFLMTVLTPLEQKTKSMQNQLSMAMKPSMTSDTGFRQHELGLFIDSLPAEPDVTDILASIESIAEESGLELQQVEYKLNDKDGSVLEYQMYFPIQGEYGAIYHFISSVLMKNRAISLDQIKFEREKISDTKLKAEIRLSLFLTAGKKNKSS